MNSTYRRTSSCWFRFRLRIVFAFFRFSLTTGNFFVCQVFCTFLPRNGKNHARFLSRCMKCRRGLAMKILSVCLSVCPSLRLSNACFVTKPKKSQSRFLYHARERSFSLFFWEEEWWVRGDQFYLKFLVNRPPLERNRRFSIYFRSYSASAVTPSEKSSFSTNRNFTTRFPMSLSWTLYVFPKPPPHTHKHKGGSKTQSV